MDYSKLNETGDKVLTAQKVKIDLNTKCSYCATRNLSNYFHSEKVCVRKHHEAIDSYFSDEE